MAEDKRKGRKEVLEVGGEGEGVSGALWSHNTSLSKSVMWGMELAVRARVAVCDVLSNFCVQKKSCTQTSSFHFL